MLNQKEHYRRKILREEYNELRSKFNIPSEDKYLFRFLDGMYRGLLRSLVVFIFCFIYKQDAPAGAE